jgi:hypothetical protein
MQMNEQRRQEPQSKTRDRPGKNHERLRGRGVKELSVQRKKGCAEKENKRQTKKKENSLEVPLPTMAEYNNYPKEWQERPRGEYDKPQIDEVLQC